MSDLNTWYERMGKKYDADSIMSKYLDATRSLEEMNESIEILRRFVDDKKRYDELVGDAIDSISI